MKKGGIWLGIFLVGIWVGSFSPVAAAWKEDFEAEPATWQVAPASTGTATVSASSERVYSGGKSLKVVYTGVEVGDFLRLTPPPSSGFSGFPLGLKVRVYGAVERSQVIFRDQGGKEISLEMGSAADGQWQILKADWQETENNGLVVFPLNLREFRFYPSSPAGEFYLDSFSGEELLFKQESWAFLAGERVEVNYHVFYEGQPLTVTLHARLKKGKELVSEQSRALQLGEAWESWDFGLLPAGGYRLEVEGEWDRLAFTLLAGDLVVFPALPSQGKPFFGVVTHYGLRRSRLPDNLVLARRAGAEWIRDEVFWGAIEKEKGVFTFPSDYDAYLHEAVKQGLKPLLILDYGNSLYGGGAPTTPEQLSAWRRYVTEVVKRYQHLVKHWEVWNEFNIGAGFRDDQKGWTTEEKAAAYVPLLREAYQAVKRVDPQATVIGCVCAGTDLAFIEEVFNQGGGAYMDAVSIHPYCFPATPEYGKAASLLATIEQVRALITAKGGRQSLWITEVGWPTNVGPRGVSEEVQAAYLARTYTLLRAYGKVEAVFWYDLQDDGTDPGDEGHNFGLLHYDLSPKPGYVSLAMVTRALAGAQAAETLSQGEEGVWHYRFTGQGTETHVLWTTSGERAVTLPLSGQWQVSSLKGEISLYDAGPGGLTLTVGTSPLFVQTPQPGERVPSDGIELRLFANPLRQGEEARLQVTTREAMQGVAVSLYNLAGARVLRREAVLSGERGEISWSTGGIPCGAYLVWVEVRFTNGKSAEGKTMLLIF